MSFAFLQADTRTNDTDAYSFDGQNLGAAASSRAIVVGIFGRWSGTSSDRTLSSVTIGGVAATILAQQSSGTSTVGNLAAFAAAVVPTGTTGDVAVTFSGSMLRAGVELWRFDSLAALAAHDQAADINDPTSVTLDAPDSGAILGLAISGATGTVSWTGLTQRAENLVETNTRMSAADAAFASATADVAVSVAFSSTNANDVLLAISLAEGGAAPTASDWATNTDGDEVTAALSESGCTPTSGTGGFTLSGTSATVAGWSISGTTLTLTLSGSIAAGETVAVSYDDATAVPGGIEDGDGDPLADFSGVSVTNNVTAPDTTAPTLSGPSATKTGSTTADVSVTTDEGNGTLYVVFTGSDTAPSAAQVKAGQDHTGAAAAGSATLAVASPGLKLVGVAGLPSDSDLYDWAMHEDAAGNQSAVAGTGEPIHTDPNPLVAGSIAFDSSGPAGIRLDITPSSEGEGAITDTLMRSDDGGSFASIATDPAADYLDATAEVGPAYRYRLDPVDSATVPQSTSSAVAGPFYVNDGTLSPGGGGGGLLRHPGMTGGISG